MGGQFLPEGMKSTDYLSFYATRFDAVELDNTFYATPVLATAKSWYAKTPPGFLFAATSHHTRRSAGRLQRHQKRSDSYGCPCRKARTAALSVW